MFQFFAACCSVGDVPKLASIQGLEFCNLLANSLAKPMGEL